MIFLMCFINNRGDLFGRLYDFFQPIQPVDGRIIFNVSKYANEIYSCYITQKSPTTIR